MTNFDNQDGDDETPTSYNRRRTDPWWINAIYKIGIPSAIAAYLVYFLVNTVSGEMKMMHELLVTHVGITLQEKDQNERMLYILQRICINSATTNLERNECFK